MTMQPVLPVAFDPRGLLLCSGCGAFIPYRTLRQGDDAFWRHRKHGGRVMPLRARRPGWRQFGRPRPAEPSA